jgi:hypothetical protein
MMPLYISFNQQDLETRIKKSTQIAYERGCLEGFRNGLEKGSDQTVASMLVQLRQFYEDLYGILNPDRSKETLSEFEKIDSILLRCLTLVRIEHYARVKLQEQAEDDNRIMQVDSYQRAQAEINLLKDAQQSLKQQLHLSEEKNLNLERRNKELQQVILDLQNMLDGAINHGK